VSRPGSVQAEDEMVADPTCLSVTVPGLDEALELAVERHGRLCPRQVLGARIGLAALDALELPFGRADRRRLLAFVETDGCFVDGVEGATGCSMGHRTLQLRDLGKVAAVFVDLDTRAAVRIAPRLDVRTRALEYAPGELRHYYAQLEGYQRMPAALLLDVRAVRLRDDIPFLVGRPGIRVNCSDCGEEIINGREVASTGRVRCGSCATGAFYEPVELPAALCDRRRSVHLQASS